MKESNKKEDNKAPLDSSNSVIDALFDESSLPTTVPDDYEGLPSLKISSLSETKTEIEKNSLSAEKGGVERRQFTRIDVLEKKIELKFSNSKQFARQYVENISMGGLFVKTEIQAELGDNFPIEFQIPSAGGEASTFRLKAKVCRVIKGQGLGLEFIDLTDESRKILESFVRTSLPQGLDIVPKVKAATVERLEFIREMRREEKKKQIRLAKQIASILLLVVLNSFLYIRMRNDQNQQETNRRGAEHILVGNKNLLRKDLQMMARDKDGKVHLIFKNGEEVIWNGEGVLPQDLRQTLQWTEGMKTKSKVRKIKNASHRRRN